MCVYVSSYLCLHLAPDSMLLVTIPTLFILLFSFSRFFLITNIFVFLFYLIAFGFRLSLSLFGNILFKKKRTKRSMKMKQPNE